jgi:hypothetical protein
MRFFCEQINSQARQPPQGAQLDTVSGARLVPSRSTGKCNSGLESFYELLSANGAAASWDNSRSGGRADTVLLCTQPQAEQWSIGVLE